MKTSGGTRSEQRQPFFTIAAWFSVIVPALGGVVAWLTSQPPLADAKGIPVPVLAVLAATFAISFVAGFVSLWGAKTNGAVVILPPALIGMLLSAALELLAITFLILSNLPGP